MKPHASAPAFKPAQAKRSSSAFFWRAISPEMVMLAIWSAGLLAYLIIDALRVDMTYLNKMIAGERLSTEVSMSALLWIMIALTFFVGGAMLAPGYKARPKIGAWSDAKAFRALTLAFTFVSLIAFLWVGVTVMRVGAGTLMRLAETENVAARDLILSGSFPGGRLVSNGYIGLAIFSAMMLARIRERPLPARIKTVLFGMLIFSLLYLGTIPILISGRINFFAAIIASYIAACIARRRFFGLIYLPLALALMAMVWTAKQYYSLQHTTTESVFVQSYQGFLFYVYNDILNALNVIGNLNGHLTYGYFSSRFFFFFTFTDGTIVQTIAPQLDYLSQFLGGGEFPLLTAPYVDYGWLGLIPLLLLGGAVKMVYFRARIDPEFGALYALLFAGLCLSIHSSYITLQDPVFSVLLLAALLKFSRVPERVKRKGRNRQQQPSRIASATLK